MLLLSGHQKSVCPVAAVLTAATPAATLAAAPAAAREVKSAVAGSAGVFDPVSA